MSYFQVPEQVYYLFLTKYPERYRNLEEIALLPHSENFWYGTTITQLSELERLRNLPPTVHRFVSIEPIMDAIDLDLAPTLNAVGSAYIAPVEWIIAGAETGSQPGKHTPRKEWLMSLVDYAHRNKIPILLKDSEELRDIWGDNLIQEFPQCLEPMAKNSIPHCKKCQNAISFKQGKRGVAYACDAAHEMIGQRDLGPKHIPGRFTRTSPPWCPRREEDISESDCG